MKQYQSQFPKCDNCKMDIKIKGKFIKEGGLIKYVHLSYNNKTGECR